MESVVCVTHFYSEQSVVVVPQPWPGTVVLFLSSTPYLIAPIRDLDAVLQFVFSTKIVTPPLGIKGLKSNEHQWVNYSLVDTGYWMNGDE